MDDYELPPERKKSGSSCMLFGCGGAVVLVLAALGSVWFGLVKLRGMAAEEVYTTIVDDMASMDLEAGERAEAEQLLTRLRDAFTEGDAGFDELEKLGEALSEGELLVYSELLVGKKLIAAEPDLTDEEKEAGNHQLSRFAAGQSAGTLDGDDFNDLLATIGEADPEDGSIEINDNPTADELRALIALAQSKADEAGVGEEGLEIDFVAEIRDLVESVLGPEDPANR